MLHNIIHISDIHIRSGDSKKSRYDEYISVFNNLTDSISEQPSILNKSAVIVITGDIFHDKNRIGPSGIKIATYLLQKLSTLATVIVIRGNHDYRQDHPTEHDMISALISYNIHNVIYFDTTDIHKFQNISFGLTAIQETLLYGSTSGISNNLPPFPVPYDTNTYKVALFHGTINGCTLQNGSKTTRDGYPIDWFQGYDAILLGDIHLQQINRASIIDSSPSILPHTTICQTYSYQDQIPWGYAGSLIQQDFGETIKGHGYILWNLQEKLIHVYHIKNNYGMIKINFNGNIDELEVEHKQYIKPITRLASLHKIISTKWFPDNLHIRVFSNQDISANNLRMIAHKIQSFGKNVLTITKKSLNKNNSIVDNNNNTETNSDSSEILNINSTDSLVDYIQNKIITDNKSLSSDKWKQWILHPETLLLPLNHIPDKISSKIQSKSAAVDKSAKEYIQEFEKVQSHNINSANMILHKLEWSWVLNYKNNNVFDFRKNTKSISVLNAKNGSGKSNFLEIICIALFGEGFPSRHNTNYSSTIICDKKPSGVMASTRITFSLNDMLYMIERTMRNNTNKRSINFEDVTLYKIINDTKEILHQKNVAVSSWIDLNIGKCSTYLMSTMLTQNADSDFFSLDYKTQKELLDRVLSLDHINSLKKLLKDTLLYYKYSGDLIESYYDGIKSSTSVVEQATLDKITGYKSELESLRLRSENLSAKWHMCSERDLGSITDIQSIETHISQLQKRHDSLHNKALYDVQMTISDVNSSIRDVKDELAKFHSFSDLESIDSTETVSQDTPIQISHLLLYLQQHPFYKKADYDLYENIHSIESKINLDGDKSDEQNSDLIKIIYDFQTWNRLQADLFERDRNYFENESEIQKLHTKINLLISSIQSFPDKILTSRKLFDKLRKNSSKLLKEKELVMDKRPNKPVKGREWLDEVALHISEYGDLDEHMVIKQFIANSIRAIPVVCNNIHNMGLKISECIAYIKECSDYAYNDQCWACKKQPWRTKYNAAITELPDLKKSLEDLKEELVALKYDGIEGELTITNYKKYITELEEYLEVYSGHIADIKLYMADIKSHDEWSAWITEYDIIKLKCETVANDISQTELDKLELETDYEKAKVEKQAAQSQLESIQLKKREYELYLEQRGEREATAGRAHRSLDYNWYSTLYSYRIQIASYIKWNLAQMTELRVEFENAMVLLKATEEREKISKELAGLVTLYDAYPSWLEWKEVCTQSATITLKINELEVLSKGYNITGDTQMVNCLQLLSTIKSDNLDISYIAEAFTGYREWLYTHNIGPIIQKRVNGILEMMCEDRPLYLECEWLDKIDTLSWFMRDGESRVIIQKASGFQRFIIGVAMRVAFNQIGFSRIRFSELFIDEGFTACDTDNLERIPEFLRGLLGFYNTIYLATHLEDLKGCADKQILIKRGDDGLSQIQYGDMEMIAEIVTDEKLKAKKRGRPSRDSVVVIKI
jgi:DNA repair exonuclease SbcCD ATPase subunit/DNA repair exonuclease SbcCD nuclease subunit